MTAFSALLAFVLGGVTTFFVVRKTIGERRWRDGYLDGFNLAWDEKADADEKARQELLKKIRKTRPKLLIIKGEKK